MMLSPLLLLEVRAVDAVTVEMTLLAAAVVGDGVADGANVGVKDAADKWWGMRAAGLPDDANAASVGYTYAASFFYIPPQNVPGFHQMLPQFSCII